MNLLEGGRRLAPLEEFSLSKPGFFALAGSERQQGTERSGKEEPTQQGRRGGLISPLGGARREPHRRLVWVGDNSCSALRSTAVPGIKRGNLGFKKVSQELCPRHPRERAELSPQVFLFFFTKRILISACSYSALPQEVPICCVTHHLLCQWRQVNWLLEKALGSGNPEVRKWEEADLRPLYWRI